MKAIILLALLLDISSAACTSALSPFTFDSMEVPENFTAAAQEIFYVSDAQAIIEFKGFKIEGGKNSKGLELAVVPHADYQKLNENSSFCTGMDANFKLIPEAGSGIIPLEDVLKADVERDVTESGVYVLLLSNCGTDSMDKSTTVSGKVRVRNAHGYLSGIDIGRRHVHGWIASIYVVLAIAWVAYLLVHRKALTNTHSALTFCLVVNSMSTIFYFVGLSDCNSSGEIGVFLQLAESGEILQPIMIGTHLILTIIGWGRLPDKESKSMSIATFVAQAIACVSLSIVQDAGQLRQYTFASSTIIYASAAPIFLIVVVTSIWIGCRLSSSMKQCIQVDNEYALRFFKRVSLLSACAMVMCLICLAVYIADVPQQGEHFWYFHSLARDLIPQMMMIAFFSMMLVLHKPAGMTAQFAKLPSDEGHELTIGASKLETGDEHDDEEMFAIEGHDDEEEALGSDKARAGGVGAMTIGVPVD